MTKYPYDDETMTYDKATHKYYLTENGVLQELGINLSLELQNGNQGKRVERFLRKITAAVYGYIYEDSFNSLRIERDLAKHAPLRTIIKQMLLSQVEYALENNFIQDFSGVNISKGSAMRASDLRGRMRVSSDVELLCRQTIVGLPYTLKTILPLPPVPECEMWRDY